VTSTPAVPMALTIRVASSNEGKLRDFAGAAAAYGVKVEQVKLPENTPPPREDAPTFEANAAVKAEYYSRYAKDEYVIADDSGLCVEQLAGAPGVYSARYAAILTGNWAEANDAANNAHLLRKMEHVPDENRDARFVCCIAVARNGRLVAMFRGEVPGVVLRAPRGTKGFGYDPLFLIPQLNKTFAELDAEEKAGYSHRGMAFAKLLKWITQSSSQ
jgi:XTP/dITP diphosphohydrolase